MIFCLVCGVANRDGSRFCNACGRRVDGAVQCAQCGVPNPIGSRFCSQCGSIMGPHQLGAPLPQVALGEPAWGASIAAAAVVAEEDAALEDAETAPLPPGRRSLAGIEALSAEDLTLFEAPQPSLGAASLSAPPVDAERFAGAIALARSWRARLGPTQAPRPEAPPEAVATLVQIVGRDRSA